MNYKFLAGFFLGFVVIPLFVGAGFYFFVFSRSPAPPPSAVTSENAPLPGAGVDPEAPPLFQLRVKIPPFLSDSFPPSAKVLARFVSTGRHDFSINLDNVAKRNGDEISFEFSKELEPIDYRLSLKFCPTTSGNCLKEKIFFDARKWIKGGDLQGKKVDLGVIPLGRWYRDEPACRLSEPLLAGTVKAVGNFGKAPPGRKLALVLLSIDNTGMPPPAFQRDNDKAPEGTGFIQTMFMPPNRQYVLYAGAFEPKAEGFSFTAPTAPSYCGPVVAAVTECAESDSYEKCAENVFPIPANANSVPGRFYRLVGKELVVPMAGEKNIEFYLYKFPYPGAESKAGESKAQGLPAEIFETSSYY
jgi:hypothetical protein